MASGKTEETGQTWLMASADNSGVRQQEIQCETSSVQRIRLSQMSNKRSAKGEGNEMQKIGEWKTDVTVWSCILNLEESSCNIRAKSSSDHSHRANVLILVLSHDKECLASESCIHNHGVRVHTLS